MISDLLEALPPEKYLQLRDAFENEYTFECDVVYKDVLYFVGVNIPDTKTTLAREGHYAYGIKPC
jgi:hypothetical protein